MTTLFITSSGTGIGKTYVTLCLLAQLAAAGRTVRALKPVASGFDAAQPEESDTGLLLKAQRLALTPANLDAVSPWRFAAPLAPDMAAAREGRAIDFAALTAFCRTPAAASADVTLIEGVGGVMVPLTDEHTVLDWIAALEASALVVVGSYLGSLSHSLTAVNALRARAVPIAGIVVSQSLDEPVATVETAATLGRFLGTIPIAVLARGGHVPLLEIVAPQVA
jgi:dethiobiotin synthetase